MAARCRSASVSSGDAIVYCLQLRHRQNATWRQVLDDGAILARSAPAIEEIGGTGPFQQGLYGCSEMFVDGYLDLYRSGILKRRVFPQLQLQRLLNAGTIGERVTPELLEQLVAAGLPSRLSAGDFATLQHVGVFNQECRFADGRIGLPSGKWVEADLGDPEVRRELATSGLGVRLRNGALLHGGFFLGPKGFYAALRDLPEGERRQFNHDERRLHQSAVRARHGIARRATPACPLHQYGDDDDADRGRDIRRPGGWQSGERCRRSIQLRSDGACVARRAFGAVCAVRAPAPAEPFPTSCGTTVTAPSRATCATS